MPLLGQICKANSSLDGHQALLAFTLIQQAPFSYLLRFRVSGSPWISEELLRFVEPVGLSGVLKTGINHHKMAAKTEGQKQNGCHGGKSQNGGRQQVKHSPMKETAGFLSSSSSHEEEESQDCSSLLKRKKMLWLRSKRVRRNPLGGMPLTSR